MAGVPEKVIARAKELVEELSDADITIRAKEIAKLNGTNHSKKRVPKMDEVDFNQLTLFDAVKDDHIINELKEMDLGTMTPIDALNTLYRLQMKIKNRI